VYDSLRDFRFLLDSGGLCRFLLASSNPGAFDLLAFAIPEEEVGVGTWAQRAFAPFQP
jgi:hypothetical protein